MFAGESSTQVSPFVPGGVSDGNWHTVYIRYYNKVGFSLYWTTVCILTFTFFLRSLSPQVIGGILDHFFVYVVLGQRFFFHRLITHRTSLFCLISSSFRSASNTLCEY